jgi:hypothetical protein
MTIAINKRIGRDTYIEIQPGSTGAWIPVWVQTRDFDTEETAEELDVTVRGDNGKVYEDGFADRKMNMSGLFEVGEETPFWENLTLGAQGSINWYDEGKEDGKPVSSSVYKVLSRKKSYPYAGVVSADIGMRLNDAITEDTYDAP